MIEMLVITISNQRKIKLDTCTVQQTTRDHYF